LRTISFVADEMFANRIVLHVVTLLLDRNASLHVTFALCSVKCIVAEFDLTLRTISWTYIALL